MSFKIFLDKWDDRHTAKQKKMALDFLHVLDECVFEARKLNIRRKRWPQVQVFEDDADSPKIQAWHKIAKGLKMTPRAKTYQRAVTIGAMVFGSAVEEEAYYLLADKYQPVDGQPGDYTLETPWRIPPLFPHSFYRRGDRKGSRPDVRLALGNGCEALFDITSKASEGHILKKGCVPGNWLTRNNIPFIAEVFYDPL